MFVIKWSITWRWAESQGPAEVLSKNREEVSYWVTFEGAAGNKSKVPSWLVTRSWFLLLCSGWQNLKR